MTEEREPIAIPSWVPLSLRTAYSEIAARFGEEEAASQIRSHKRNMTPKELQRDPTQTDGTNWASRLAGREAEDGEMTITGEQMKAARILLGWTMDDLARSVRLSEMDIARFEAGTPRMPSIGAALIRRALEGAGVEFDDKGHGVRMREGKL